jgi:hypothetical protein
LEEPESADVFEEANGAAETPPSLVKLSSRARGVRIGSGISAPRRDQVPELRYGRVFAGFDGGDGGTGVVAGGDDDRGVAIGAEDGAGSCDAGQEARGEVEGKRSSVDQLRLEALRRWVVVALVYSAAISPVSQ